MLVVANPVQGVSRAQLVQAQPVQGVSNVQHVQALQSQTQQLQALQMQVLQLQVAQLQAAVASGAAATQSPQAALMQQMQQLAAMQAMQMQQGGGSLQGVVPPVGVAAPQLAVTPLVHEVPPPTSFEAPAGSRGTRGAGDSVPNW